MINEQKPSDFKALIPISEPAHLASCIKCRATISSKKTGCTFCKQNHVNKDALARPGDVVASPDSSIGTLFKPPLPSVSSRSKKAVYFDMLLGSMNKPKGQGGES